MFNPELKEQYIEDSNYTETRENIARQIFGVTEKYEEQWGSDICTRSVTELQPVVDVVAGYKKHSCETTLSYLHTYCRWCLDHNVAGATDALLQIKGVTDSKLKAQMVPNPNGLQEYLNDVFEPENHRKLDNTFRCFYWLAYSGLEEEDAYTVRASEVDFVRMLIKHNNREYPIYEEALPAMMNCVVLTAFSSNSVRCSSDAILQRGDGDVLIRGTKPITTKATLKPFLSRISTKAVSDGKTQLKLSYNRVRDSGMFYRMYQREQEGFRVSFSAVALEYLREKNKDNPDKVISRLEINRKSSSYLSEYKRWKKAFYS